MRVTAPLQKAYREELKRLGDEAAGYVSEFLKAVRSQFPDASVADIREAAREAIEDALYAFGDQAGALACELFDEVCEAEGIDARATLSTDAISREMLEDKLHYFAGRLVEGDAEGFDKKVSGLTRFYVKRTAYENMVRNCDVNDVRYARVPSGLETCGFCFMLSSRGFVYRSELTARGDTPHGMHDHCDCIIVPGERDATVIDGYDPEGMAGRLSQCEAAIGGEAGAREAWDALTEDERAAYKGYSDKEKYERFKLDRLMREVETRDWKWLYTGKEPEIDYTLQPRESFGVFRIPGDYSRENLILAPGEPEPNEWRDLFVHDMLKRAGIQIKTRPAKALGASGKELQGVSNPDLEIDGKLWEIKSPKKNSNREDVDEASLIDYALKDSLRNFRNPYDYKMKKGMGDRTIGRKVILNECYCGLGKIKPMDTSDVLKMMRFYKVSGMMIIDRDGKIRRYRIK